MCLVSFLRVHVRGIRGGWEEAKNIGKIGIHEENIPRSSKFCYVEQNHDGMF